ncbi:MAG TPA: hypothetical protein VFO70_06555 [Chitinophagaceae bacterium]|nr:hypothetical protein [Chitinophagaceae bacterium]
MYHRQARWAIVLFPLIFVAGCGMDGDSRTNPRQGRLFLDYRITGDETKDDVTVLIQFRKGGINGINQELLPPEQVQLDGETLEPDSSRFTGIYYETELDVIRFTGNHIIDFTDFNNNQLRQEFSYQPLKLLNSIPGFLPRANILLHLEGLDSLDYVRVVLTDTSYTSQGINKLDTIRGGKLTIHKYELEQLKNGPIHLEIMRENEKAIKEGTRTIGRLGIYYRLSREFNLRD